MVFEDDFEENPEDYKHWISSWRLSSLNADKMVSECHSFQQVSLTIKAQLLYIYEILDIFFFA